MKKIFFIILLFVLNDVVCQEIKEIGIPSPETASITKFIEAPVSYNTGIPNISVPLYTVKSG
mgnify:CR=1 FL=1|tara:strand:- start:227 stop:412 length:186 start_codon:yes stop_codon:yes gene_type:complete